MKAALNDGLNLSVLDGWWIEAFDRQNGWAINSEPTPDVQDYLVKVYASPAVNAAAKST